ncbi:DUF4234 domain-containing protein [Streptomyces sp. RFCAC02]|uniref:DUF4234 domain-containing protein n=1 Tax=Streptomyces sp. RFCAC02 TaxID=2499143 RepID=UPI00101EF9CD|nr:DUF4234 domain-containing protein [Streptomyces sp. RFCAC02]
MSDSQTPPTPYGQPGVPAGYPSQQPGYPAATAPVAVTGTPYGQQTSPGMGRAMRQRNVFAAWIGLPIITLGVYVLVWQYKINKELAQFDRRIVVSPGLSTLAIFPGVFLLYIPLFVAVYNTGKRVAQAQRAAGMAATCSPAIAAILVVVLSSYRLYIQSEINKIHDHYRNPPEGTPVPLMA